MAELKSFKKAILPHLYTLLFFVLISVIYFYPVVFQGKTVRSHDIVQYQGMAKELTDLRKAYGEEPYWTNAMFSGMPNTLVNMEHWGNLVKPIHNAMNLLFTYPTSLIILSLLSFYVLMMAFGVSLLPSVAASVAFSFSTFNFISIEAGHNAKLACMAYMPLVLAGMVWAYRRHRWQGATLMALASALQVSNNHVQITYYLAFVALAYGVAEAYIHFTKSKMMDFAKTSAVLALAFVLGLATHAGYFMAVQDYSPYSIRGKAELSASDSTAKSDGLDKEYAFQYSYGIDEPLTWLFPNYMGGASSGPLDTKSATYAALRENGYADQAGQILGAAPLYFGDQPYVAGPMYMGAVVLFLALLALVMVADPIKWFLLGISLLAMLLTYGRNFPALNYLIFDYFPMYNKFRSVTMAVVIPQVCFAILAGLGLEAFFSKSIKTQRTSKDLLYTTLGLLGFAVLVYFMATTASYVSPNDELYRFPNWLIQGLMQDRQGMRTADILRSVFFIALAFGVLYFANKGNLSSKWAAVVVAGLLLLDLWLVDRRYLNGDSFEKKVIETYYAPTPADALVLQDKDPNYRVFNLNNPFNDARTSYFHHSIGGYSPAKLRRYQDLIERRLSVELEHIINTVKTGNLNVFDKTPTLNMLNARYLIASEEENGVLRNDSALGNAWFVQDIRTVSTPDEEIDALNYLQPKYSAVINTGKFNIVNKKFTLDSGAYIQQLTYKPYRIEYTTTNDNPGFAVFSEVYYPKGWTATIDGVEQEIKCVNYVLRGLEVPAGNHKIVFEMTNQAHKTGNLIGLIASLLLYGALGYTAYQAYKSTK